MSTPHPLRAGVDRSRSDVGVSTREDDGPAPPPAGSTDTEPMPAVFFRPAMSQDLSELSSFRKGNISYRKGNAEGATGEVGQTGGASEASGSDFERRILNLFRIGGVNAAEDDHRAAEVDSYLETLGNDFVNSPCVNSPDVTCAEIAERFTKSELPDQPQETSAYFAELAKTVVEDATHTSSPLLVGHMTSALPYYTRPLAKLVVSMNQNVVKTETAKTVTFLEREAMAQVHKIIYGMDTAFYEEHVQNTDVMLGLFTSGGTMANVTALWVARNNQLGPTKAADGGEAKEGSEEVTFKGVESEGLPRALRHYGYDDAIVIGSALVHYSLNKAVDLLGLGTRGIVKIPVDDDYRVDLDLLEAKIVWARANKVMILAIVGICGATETGAIDPLEEMAELAKKYDIHFHVDAAWGGPCIFSESQVEKAKGIELADTVTLDGHKQLYMPMGSGLLFMRDPYLSHAVRKTANYIIRKESYDLGKFTVEGSRPANALFLHANLNILGVQGFRCLVDRTVRIAQYMARCILRSSNFELLVKPMTNILLYRWVPQEFRQESFEGTLSPESNKIVDGCNVRLQDTQKNAGKTFVSRTTIKCPKYNQHPVVGLRVVIGNPLTTEADIDRVFADQTSIIDSGVVYKDFAEGSGLIPKDDHAGGYDADTSNDKTFWRERWTRMSARERFLFRDNEDAFFQALVTPDCYLDRELAGNPEAGSFMETVGEADAGKAKA